MAKADLFHMKILFKNLQLGCRKIKVEELTKQEEKERAVEKFIYERKFNTFQKVISNWKTYSGSSRRFHERLNAVLSLRAKNICKVVYSSWATFTKKRERYRKTNQIAACFYLRNTYQKVFQKGFKLHYNRQM